MWMAIEVDEVARALRHGAGPERGVVAAAAVAPGDQGDGRVARPHGAGELDRVRDGLVAGEAVVAVRCLVADLPELDVEGLGRAVAAALRVVRVVAVGHPVGGLGGVARAVALGRAGVVAAAVAEEVDAGKELGADLAAQARQLGRADAVPLPAAPDVVAHRWPAGGRAHTLAPPVVAGEQAAVADDVRRQVGGGGDEVAPPRVRVPVPGGLDRAVGQAERLHELHVEPGRDRKEGMRVDADEVGARRHLRRGQRAGRGRHAVTQQVAPRPPHAAPR